MEYVWLFIGSLSVTVGVLSVMGWLAALLNDVGITPMVLPMAGIAACITYCKRCTRAASR
jgi:hypothetical protein